VKEENLPRQRPGRGHRSLTACAREEGRGNLTSTKRGTSLLINRDFWKQNKEGERDFYLGRGKPREREKNEKVSPLQSGGEGPVKALREGKGGEKSPNSLFNLCLSGKGKALSTRS